MKYPVSVKITSSRLSMTETVAHEIGRKKGGILGRLFVREDMTRLSLLYFPFSIIDFYYEKMEGLWNRMFMRNNNEGHYRRKIAIICDKTTGSTALAEAVPVLETVEVPEDHIQPALFKMDDLLQSAQNLAFRVLRKHVLGAQNIIDFSSIQLYRPYYVAYYGEYVEGNKVRYLPVAADGFGTKRAL
jgi:hypothetical protein